MNISELIKALEYQKKTYGNIDVEIDFDRKYKASEIHFFTNVEKDETTLTLANYPIMTPDNDDEEEW